MSRLLMLASFICFLSLNSILKLSVFFNSLTRISSKKCEKMNTIIKSNYDRYNRLVRGNSVMLARFFSSFLAGNRYFEKGVFCRILEWKSPNFFFKSPYLVLYSTQILVDIVVLFMAVVKGGNFLFYFLAVNPNLNQVVFSLW